MIESATSRLKVFTLYLDAGDSIDAVCRDPGGMILCEVSATLGRLLPWMMDPVAWVRIAAAQMKWDLNRERISPIPHGGVHNKEAHSASTHKRQYKSRIVRLYNHRRFHTRRPRKKLLAWPIEGASTSNGDETPLQTAHYLLNSGNSLNGSEWSSWQFLQQSQHWFGLRVSGTQFNDPL